MKYLQIASLLSLLLVATSCLDTKDDDGAYSDILAHGFVLEGWMTVDGYPTVILTTPLDPSAGEASVADCVVRWALVTISDGARTVVLTGGPDSSVFPPYSYREFQMAGEEGATYTVTARYGNRSATATATMGRVPEVTGVTFGTVEGNDTLVSATVHFRHTPGTEGWYLAFTRAQNTDTRLLPSLMGFKHAGPEEADCSMPLFRGRTAIDTTAYVPNFCHGEVVDYVLAGVSKEAYDYYRAYDELTSLGANVFLTTGATLNTNVSGGLGYWLLLAGHLNRITIP